MRQLKITKSITIRESGSLLEKYFQDIKKEALISTDEEIFLTQRIRKGDQWALEKLCKANLRFVVSVAKQYQNQGLSLPDLINEGNLGLINAAKRFDETRGFKFISYAVWWIRQNILQALAEQSYVVTIPVNKVEALKKIKKVSARLEQKFERLPSYDEIAEELEIPRYKIEAMLSASLQYISMDAPFSENEDTTFIDIFIDPDTPATDNELMRESLAREIERSLATITERERDVISLYFGLRGLKALTLEEIGARYNWTRERARQVKDGAVRRLKNQKRSKILKTYLG